MKLITVTVIVTSTWLCCAGCIYYDVAQSSQLYRMVDSHAGSFKWPLLSVDVSLQCESKNPPCGFLTFFPKRMGNFLINFYTPIIRSFLH